MGSTISHVPRHIVGGLRGGDGAMAEAENSSGSSPSPPGSCQDQCCDIGGFICSGLCLPCATLPHVCSEILYGFNPRLRPLSPSGAEEGFVQYSQQFVAAVGRGLRVEPHIRGFIFNIVPVVLLFAIIGMAADNTLYYTSGVYKGQMKGGSIVLIVWFFITYIFYLVEARCCATYRYLYMQKDPTLMSEYVEKIQRAVPTIHEHAHCYHTETRTRSVTTTDANGQTHTRLETYTVTVTTHTDAFAVLYDSLRDLSLIPDYKSFEISKVQCTKNWKPTAESADLYNRMVANFQAAHMNCDSQRSFYTTVELDGFEPSILTFAHKNRIPLAVKYGKQVYFFCSLFLLSWVYKLYLSGIAAHLSIQFSKEVNVLPNERVLQRGLSGLVGIVINSMQAPLVVEAVAEVVDDEGGGYGEEELHVPTVVQANTKLEPDDAV